MTAMDTIDLHTHSTYSDGTLSPRQIVDLAAATKLKAVAITDHDTTAGIAEALARGRELDLEVVSGVEISAQLDGQSMHLLGYGIRHDDPLFLERLGVLQTARKDRNSRIFAKLNTLGIPARIDQLPPTPGQTGRPHIARLLIAQGVVQSMDQAFARFLRRGAAAYVESYRMPADHAIAMIAQAGGLAFLAHPVGDDPKLKTVAALLKKLKDVGLAGLELYYPTHTPQTHAKLHKLGRELGLLFSGGSDFHGASKPHMPLGGRPNDKPVPYQLLAAIKARLNSRPSTERQS